LALTRDGKVYGSGDNQYGQLTGTGNKNTFTEITSGLEGKTIIAIATGAFHSLVLDSLGKVYGTGANWGGQLAYPANPIDAWTVSTFTEVTGLENKRIIAIAGAERTSLALASDGSVYAAGVNSQWPNYDQLSDQSSDGGNDFLLSFTKVSGLDDVTITAISMSTGQVAVVTSQGEVYLAGYHIVAREDEDPSTIFTKAIGLEGVPIVAISTYSTHTLALSRSGRVYGSGRYSVIGAGRAGDGSTEYAEFIPVVFSDGPAKEKKITAISAGFYFSLALTDEGKVYGVGNGFRGDTYARPNNATEHRFYPSTGLTNQIITAIAAGYESSLAMNSLGQVYGTGKNDAGQLTGVVYPAPPSYHLPDLRYIPTFTLATGL
jgi:alpha-tubulin suppressor-like RCC1 family protein